MDDILTIAQSTFYRVARLKSLYVILVICVLDVLAMAAYADLSLGMEKELMFDCALALALVVGLITAMVAAFEIPRELREKTAQFILSKPMGRSAFIWGKFFGETRWELAAGGVLLAAEALVLTGIGLLLSIFLTDTLAAIGQFAFFAIGHSLFMLPRTGMNNVVTRGLAHVFPNFHHLDIKTELSHQFIE